MKKRERSPMSTTGNRNGTQDGSRISISAEDRQKVTMIDTTKYREDLNLGRCSTPGCKCDDSQIVYQPGCHRRGVEAVYERQTGTMLLRCYVCGAFVMRIAVANRA